MSYRIRNTLSKVSIPKEKVEDLFKTLKANPIPGGDTRELLRALDLREAFQAYGHTAKEGKGGDIVGLYVYWEGYDEPTFAALYNLIAPFVQVNCVQEFTDEYGTHWRYRFDGTRAVHQTGEVTYKDTTP